MPNVISFQTFSTNIKILNCTGKFLSALIFASTNTQYDNRLFIELRVQYMKIASSEEAEAQDTILQPPLDGHSQY